MIFKLSTAASAYDKDDQLKLAKLGFSFREPNDKYRGNRLLIEGNPSINIDSMDDLLKFVYEFGQIVVDIDASSGDAEIIIYDGYLE